MTIFLISPHRVSFRGQQCGGTMAEAESDGGIRPRHPSEIVHHKEQDIDSYCDKCGTKESKFVWLSSDTAWELHPMRCKP